MGINLFKRSWLILLPLFLILYAYSNDLLDPTQPIKFFTLSIFCFSFNCVLAFRINKFDRAIFKNLVVKIYVIYIIICAISLLYTDNLISGIHEILKIFLYFNFLLLGIYFLKNKEDFNLSYLLNFFYIFQLLIVITAVISIIFNYTNDVVWFKMKFTGNLFANSNLCSQILFLLLPFSLYGIYAGRNRRGKVFPIIASLSALFIIFLLASKAVIIALIIMLVVMASIYFYNKKPSKTRILSITAILLILIVGTSIMLSTYSTSILEINSFQVRKELWSRTFLSIKDKPILGHGIGSWRVSNWNYLPENIDSENEVIKLFINTKDGSKLYERPHNDFLWILSEIGVLGFICYSLLFLAAFRNSLKAINKTHGKKKMLFMLLAGTLAGYIVIALFSYPKERIEQSVLLILIFILIINSSSSKNESLNNSIKFNKVVLTILLGISLFSVYLSFQRLVSEYHFTKANIAKQNNNWRLLLRESLLAKKTLYPYGSNGTPVSWYLGLATINLNQIEAAHLYFQEAFKEHKNHVHVLNNLATTYVMNGQTLPAKNLYKKALRINPNFEDARINLSGVYFNEGNIDEAWQHISKISYKSKHPQYMTFVEVIIRAKYKNELMNLAVEREHQEYAEAFLKSPTNRYFLLYKESLIKEHSIQETFLINLETFVKRYRLKFEKKKKKRIIDVI